MKMKKVKIKVKIVIKSIVNKKVEKISSQKAMFFPLSSTLHAGTSLLKVSIPSQG
jgi:hypothetical protein